MWQDRALGGALLEFKHDVEAVMGEFPELHAISWYRDWTHNAEEGGQPLSQHLLGLAIDLDWMGADLDYFKAAGASAVERGLTAIVYWNEEKRSLHLQALPPPMDESPFVPLLSWPGDFAQLWTLIFNRLRWTPQVVVKT